jgi:hypothetical protein
MPKLPFDGQKIEGSARSVAKLCAVVLLCTGVGSAFAQSNQGNPFGGGSRLGPKDAQIVQTGVDAARKVMQTFGKCIYERSPAKAERFMALPMDVPEYRTLGRQMSDEVGDRCLSGDGELQFDDGLFRGALFEAAYRKKFAALPATSFEGTQSVGWLPAYAKPWSEAAKRHIIVQDLAECVVRGDPALAHALMLSSTGSPKEKGIVGQLASKLGPCLMSGQKAQISKPSLRSFLAEALYRLSVARTQPAGGQ